MDLSSKNMELQSSVLAEMEWDPVVRHAQIVIIVADNVVTLTGCASCDAIRRAAEDAARRVRGVKAVVNCIDVLRPVTNQPTDAELERVATLILKSTAQLPAEGLRVAVQDGWVSLSGQLPWRQQRILAEHVVSQLRGVAGVANLITVNPAELAEDTSRKIECALRRSGGLDAQWITVEAYKGKVVLRGSVRSWQEYAQAEEIASRAPGVMDVTNHLAVLP
jgi:osmotically-inducible protein OsmY